MLYDLIAVLGMDPSVVLPYGFGAGSILYVALKVWSDNRAIDARQTSMETQLADMRKDRDEWKDLARDLQEEVSDLAIRLVRLEKYTGVSLNPTPTEGPPL